MICQLCGKDRPLTYHNFNLHLRSVCGPCIREKLPFTLGVENDPMRADVVDAIAWLLDHPQCDYVDAAFAVAANATSRPKVSEISGKAWPVFVEAVREATKTWTSGVS